MENRKRMKDANDNHRYNSKNDLNNKLICGKCGSHLRRRIERGQVFYVCAIRLEHGIKGCDMWRIKEEEINNYLTQ